jgi:hypothetical protein
MNDRSGISRGIFVAHRQELIKASVTLLAVIFLLACCMAAQQPLVCPLSESQTQKSIEAFEPVAAAFTQEDRCANCHGGVNPFTPDGHHAGEARDRSTDPDGCQECHSGLKGWTIPVSGMFFRGWVPQAPEIFRNLRTDEKYIPPRREIRTTHFQEHGLRGFQRRRFCGNSRAQRTRPESRFPRSLPS